MTWICVRIAKESGNRFYKTVFTTIKFLALPGMKLKNEQSSPHCSTAAKNGSRSPRLILAQAMKLLLMPFYAAQVFSGIKNFDSNPILGSERLNRRGLHVFRVRLAHRMAAYRRRQLTHLIGRDDQEAFERDGFVMKPDFLPADDFSRLCVEIKRLSGEALETVEGDAVTHRIPITPEILKQAPTLRQLFENPMWTGLARYIGSFDVEPVLRIMTVYAHGGPAGRHDPQTDLHMDTFHPTVKAWFFLHDVEEEEGPFTYVPGSHIMSQRRLAWQRRQSILKSRHGGGGAFRVEQSTLKRLRLPSARSFAVRGNTLLLADTYGFHARGESLRPSARVTIFASSRPSPFVPFCGFDIAKIFFIKDNKGTMGDRLQDALAKIGIARPKGRIVQVKPTDPESINHSMKSE